MELPRPPHGGHHTKICAGGVHDSHSTVSSRTGRHTDHSELDLSRPTPIFRILIPLEQLRVGTVVVDKNGALLEVVKWSYTQGQARASGNVQVEYRNLRTGGKTAERMSPSDKVERAVLDSEVGVLGAVPPGAPRDGASRLHVSAV